MISVVPKCMLSEQLLGRQLSFHLKFHLINEFCIKKFLCRESACTFFLYLNEYSYKKCVRKNILDGEKGGIFKIKLSEFQVN